MCLRICSPFILKVIITSSILSPIKISLNSDSINLGMKSYTALSISIDSSVFLIFLNFTLSLILLMFSNWVKVLSPWYIKVGLSIYDLQNAFPFPLPVEYLPSVNSISAFFSSLKTVDNAPAPFIIFLNSLSFWAILII